MATLEPKDLYSEAGELLRYYRSWREKLIAGYLAVIATLAVAFGWSQVHAPRFGSAIAVLGLLLTVVFWLFQRRNRKLFLQCIKAGASLEKDASLKGAFTRLDGDPSRPTHGNVLDCLFGLAFIALCVVALLLWRGQGVIPK